MAKITYNRGTTFHITHHYEKNGVPSSDGVKLLFTVKPEIDNDPTDANAIIKKNITMTSSTTVITIDPADVADTVEDGNYIYDLKVIEAVGPPATIYPAGNGKFILDVTATNRIAA